MNDKQIILRVLDGDMEAYGDLVRTYQASVRACLVVRLYDVSAADDLAQEAFIIAYRKLSDFDVNRDFGPWVRSIAIHCLQNYIRKKRPFAVGTADELQQLIDFRIDQLNPVEDSNTEHRIQVLTQCIKKLPPDQQELIKNRYYSKKPIAAIRASLGLAHSTVTMRLHRLREELRNCIEDNLSAKEESQ